MNKKTKNLKKTTLSFVNVGHPDTEYLHYPLDVQGLTLKGSLLPAAKMLKHLIKFHRS